MKQKILISIAMFMTSYIVVGQINIYHPYQPYNPYYNTNNTHNYHYFPDNNTSTGIDMVEVQRTISMIDEYFLEKMYQHENVYIDTYDYVEQVSILTTSIYAYDWYILEDDKVLILKYRDVDKNIIVYESRYAIRGMLVEGDIFYIRVYDKYKIEKYVLFYLNEEKVMVVEEGKKYVTYTGNVNY